jgi:hypothetical protein
MMELKDQFNVGDIRFHSVLLFNVEAVRACGPICQDLYGTYPSVQAAQYPEAARKIARYVLQQFAERGNGVYQEFSDFSGVQNVSLAALDYSSLASRNVMKSLFVQSLTSVPAADAREVDSDGDGLPDSVDNAFTHKTNNFFADSDGDCFDDAFEVARFDVGFRADAKDGRGCDPNSPLSLNCRCRDTDGDGLSQYAEDFLKTHSGLVDSDGDGVPDGLEARYGLDPLASTAAGVDTDADGVPDLAEFRADASPIQKDRAFLERSGYQYEAIPEIQSDGSVCYDFDVSNLELVTPPSRAGVRQGYNLYKLYFAEAPESAVGSDYGVWRTSCGWAQYDPPSIRVPSGPELNFVDGDFIDPAQLAAPADYQSRCVGVAP